jgi:nickel-dependent lactate racemase
MGTKIAVQLQYGKNEVSVLLPPESVIAFPHITPLEKRENVSEAFIDALRRPIDSAALSEAARGKKNAIVVIPDLTRPMPLAAMLPAILDELNAGGLSNEKIKAVIALGTHRPMTEAEIRHMVGEQTYNRIKVINHAWDKEDALICLGKTPNGTWVDVNKEVYEADMVVGLSSVKPHRAAGWSGGAKIIDPGVCGKRTIDGTHYLSVQFPIQEILGVLNNPIRREMEQVAKAVGLSFSINLVLNGEDEIVHISAGDYISSHKKAVEFAEKIYRDRQEEKADFLVSGAGPWSSDLWVAIQGIFSAEYLVKEGGTAVLLAPCEEGITPEHPQLEKVGYRPIEEIKKMVEEKTLTDLAAAGHIAAVSRILIDKGIECVLVSDESTKKTAESIGLKWMRSPQEAIDYIFKKHTETARGYLFPVKSITDTVVIPW